MSVIELSAAEMLSGEQAVSYGASQSLLEMKCRIFRSLLGLACGKLLYNASKH
jgi:hypothetical protein